MTSHPQYGDIYLVNFEPSTGHEYQKMRPAVVIQSDHQIGRSSVVTIMPLTSQTDKKLPEDILVQKNHQMWGGELWTDAFYIGTVGKGGNKRVIEEYVQKQGQKRHSSLLQL